MTELRGECPYCHGTGIVKIRDWVDYGSTTVPHDQIFDCEHCVENGLCPQCGGKLNDENECQNCHWKGEK